MKESITINKCDEEDCSEVAPAYCGECGYTLCMKHTETHDCPNFELDNKEL